MTLEDKIPPPELMEHIGGGDYIAVGQLFSPLFIKLGNLKPNHNVLEVGCGVGRMAVPLINYLKEGHYEGFDLHADAIKWCKENIESKYPNFHFNHIDLYHEVYNKNGKVQASNFKFPYKAESFDFIILTSVFTHMKPLDVKNYLSEISRVLKKGGRCFITFLLLNSVSLENIKKEKKYN